MFTAAFNHTAPCAVKRAGIPDATQSVSLCVQMKKLTAFMELESVTRGCVERFLRGEASWADLERDETDRKSLILFFAPIKMRVWIHSLNTSNNSSKNEDSASFLRMS